MCNKNIEARIITLYYKSINYGGNLQAFALCRILQNLGITAKQICYNHKDKANRSLIDILKKILTKLKKKPFSVFSLGCKFVTVKLLAIKTWLERKLLKRNVYRNIDKRVIKILNFNESAIPHTKLVSQEENTGSIKEVYITGSDQVWNTTWFIPPFFLDFVQPSKTKISYAASISKNSLTEDEKTIFKKYLADFKAISVREEQAIELLKGLTPNGVEPKWVLDPTLLLTAEDWNEVIPKDHIIKEPYLYAYFLGDSVEQRKLAKSFAHRLGLKVVNVPHIHGVWQKCDENFADIDLYEIDPTDFVNLIKYAQYIFTDSFHASIFSIIYQKKYFAFSRKGLTGMESRLTSLTKLVRQEPYFVGNEKSIEKLINLSQQPYSIDLSELNNKKRESISYLVNSIGY